MANYRAGAKPNCRWPEGRRKTKAKVARPTLRPLRPKADRGAGNVPTLIPFRALNNE